MIKITLNLLANVVLFYYSLMFYIYLFGDKNKTIYKLNTSHKLALKVGMLMITASAFFNALTLYGPPWIHVMLNIGLSLVFLWLAKYHEWLFKRDCGKVI